ncbi:MAG: hypothetical protein IMF14_00520 [Proteobacteria bacterium]|nr:hypothetical protein [Pseudomonadota bacterium]
MIFNTAAYSLAVGQISKLIVSAILLSVSTNMHGGSVQKNDKVKPAATEKQTVSSAVSSVSGSGASRKTDDWILYAEQWDIARSGETVLSLAVLNKVVNAWLQDKDKTIEVQYPGGEEGEFWVQELSDWMVSLGIPSNSIQTVPGSAADDLIRFQLSRR